MKLLPRTGGLQQDGPGGPESGGVAVVDANAPAPEAQTSPDGQPSLSDELLSLAPIDAPKTEAEQAAMIQTAELAQKDQADAARAAIDATNTAKPTRGERAKAAVGRVFGRGDKTDRPDYGSTMVPELNVPAADTAPKVPLSERVPLPKFAPEGNSTYDQMLKETEIKGRLGEATAAGESFKKLSYDVAQSADPADKATFRHVLDTLELRMRTAAKDRPPALDAPAKFADAMLTLSDVRRRLDAAQRYGSTREVNKIIDQGNAANDVLFATTKELFPSIDTGQQPTPADHTTRKDRTSEAPAVNTAPGSRMRSAAETAALLQPIDAEHPDQPFAAEPTPLAEATPGSLRTPEQVADLLQPADLAAPASTEPMAPPPPTVDTKFDVRADEPGGRVENVNAAMEQALKLDPLAAEQYQRRGEVQSLIDRSKETAPPGFASKIAEQLQKAQTADVNKIASEQAELAKQIVAEVADSLVKASRHEASRTTVDMTDPRADVKAKLQRQSLSVSNKPFMEVKSGGLFHLRGRKRGPKVIESYFRDPKNENLVVVTRSNRRTGELVSQNVITTEKPMRNRGDKVLPPKEVMKAMRDVRAQDKANPRPGSNKFRNYFSGLGVGGGFDSAVYGDRQQRQGPLKRRGGLRFWLMGNSR